MLSKGDDIYLLRLAVQTGPVPSKLSFQTYSATMSKLNKIVRTGCLPSIEAAWIEDSAHLLRSDLQLANELLDTVFEIGKSDLYSRQIRAKSQEVYDSILRDFSIAEKNNNRQ